MLGLVVAAVGAMVAFSAYAAAIHCNTIGYMMMFAGIVTVLAGAMAMYSACYEKIWGVKMVILVWLSDELVCHFSLLGDWADNYRALSVYRISRIRYQRSIQYQDADSRRVSFHVTRRQERIRTAEQVLWIRRIRGRISRMHL